MVNPEDQLRAYAVGGDEKAFAEVVEAFASLVYGTALRRVGNAQLAEEITQNVFITLARRAKKLANRSSGLGGWLYRAALLESNNALRSEAARTRRMEVMKLKEEDRAATHTSSQLRETIDDAMERLSAADRHAILLRFFEGLEFDEIGARLGKSAAAAQKQIRRALEKLNRTLATRGVSLSVASLGVALSAELAKAAPAITSSLLATNAIAAASTTKTTGTVAATLFHAMNTTKTSTAIIAILALCAIPFAFQAAAIREVRGGLNTFHEQERQFLSTKTIGESLERAEPGSTPVRRFMEATSTPLTGRSFYESFHYQTVTGDSAVMLRLNLALSRMGEDEIQALLTELESTPGHSGVRNIAFQWAAKFSQADPGGLLDRQLANGMYFYNLKDDIAHWAAKDPEAAIAWFERSRESETFKKTASGSAEELLGSALAAGVAKTDPEAAFAIASEIAPEFRNEIVASIVDSMITAGQEGQLAGRDLAVGLNDPDNAIVNLAVEAFAKNGKRESVMKFLDTLDLTPREEAVALAGAVAVDGGSGESVDDRMAWLMQNASDGARENAVGRAVSRLYRTEPAATAEWIDTLDDVALRDSALASEATVLSGSSNYPEAFARAVLIQDAERGNMTRMAILENWARRDPAAAEQAAEAAGMPSN